MVRIVKGRQNTLLPAASTASTELTSKKCLVHIVRPIRSSRSIQLHLEVVCIKTSPSRQPELLHQQSNSALHHSSRSGIFEEGLPCNAWFYYLPSMNESDCFQRSLEVEPGLNNLTPDLRRNRNNNSATSNGSNGNKMNSITRMFGYLADEFTTNLKGSSLLNGQFSNDSGIHTEESWANPNNNTPQPTLQIESSAVAMALISRGKMLATPGISCSTLAPAGAWRLNSHSASEFNPQNMQFSPHHAVQRSDPTSGARVLDVQPRSPITQTNEVANSTFGSPGAASQNSSMPSDTPSPSKSDLLQNNNLNRKMPGHQSTSSHTSSNSVASSVSTQRQKSTSFTLPTSNTSSIFSNGVPPNGSPLNFHLARVGLDEALQSENSGPMYKCIKVENGDRMTNLIERVLEKHMLDTKEKNDYCLVQLLPDGGEFRLPDHCNPYYAVAPDPLSPMLNFVLRRQDERTVLAPSAKKLNRQQRSKLTKWSSGYL